MESVSLLPMISISIILSLRRDTCNEREGEGEGGRKGAREREKEGEGGKGREREGGKEREEEGKGERGKEVQYLDPLEATKLSNNINFSL